MCEGKEQVDCQQDQRAGSARRRAECRDELRQPEEHLFGAELSQPEPKRTEKQRIKQSPEHQTEVFADAATK